MQDLKELYRAYKVKKLAFEAAKKEEEKYKKLLKDAMEAAGEKAFTDEEGYLFERIPSERKSIDEERLLQELHDRKELYSKYFLNTKLYKGYKAAVDEILEADGYSEAIVTE